MYVCMYYMYICIVFMHVLSVYMYCMYVYMYAYIYIYVSTYTLKIYQSKLLSKRVPFFIMYNRFQSRNIFEAFIHTSVCLYKPHWAEAWFAQVHVWKRHMYVHQYIPHTKVLLRHTSLKYMFGNVTRTCINTFCIAKSVVAHATLLSFSSLSCDCRPGLLLTACMLMYCYVCMSVHLHMHVIYFYVCMSAHLNMHVELCAWQGDVRIHAYVCALCVCVYAVLSCVIMNLCMYARMHEFMHVFVYCMIYMLHTM
jgi:hypothetical protein